MLRTACNEQGSKDTSKDSRKRFWIHSIPAEISRSSLGVAFLLNDVFSISKEKSTFNTAEVNFSFFEGKNTLDHMYVSNDQGD